MNKIADKVNHNPNGRSKFDNYGKSCQHVEVITPSYRRYVVAALVIAVIIYLSLYPFQWRIDLSPPGPLVSFLQPWRSWPESRGDFIANTVFYMPCGYFVITCFTSRIPALLRLLATLLLCTVLSVTLELSQFYIAHRFSDVRDTYANSIGTLLGAAAALIFGAGERLPLLAIMRRNPFPTLLIAAFVSARLYPYVPVIDLHKYLRAIRPLLAFAIPSGDEVFLRTACWMGVYFALEYVFGRRWVVPLFVAVAALVFGGQIVIDNAEVRVGELLGAMIALPLSFILTSALRRPATLFALIFTAAVVIERLQPFDFSPISHGFGWLPFAALVHGSNEHSLITISEKTFLYGTLIWLWVEAGLPGLLATTGIGLSLLLCSFAEMYIPTRVAETTDAVLALLLGGFMLFLAKRHPRSQEITELTIGFP